LPVADLTLLEQAARKAGELALTYWGGSFQHWDKPEDAGPVTEADLAVNDLLHDILMGARPTYGWLSEETQDDATRLTKDRCFIIDPIDGTRSFIAGEKTWSHSIAVVENGQVIAGVVYLPATNVMYRAAGGAGAFVGETRMQVQGVDHVENARILANRAVMTSGHWVDGSAPDFDRHHRPSLAYRMAAVAEGKFDGMITLRPTWEWDVAAGVLMVEEAGGVVSDRTGNAVRFNNPTPQSKGLIATTHTLRDQFLDKLDRV
jgi:myo-inositol-1(or 4)-monophosphatase